MKYEFTLALKNAPDLTEEMAGRLFEAGCQDGTPGTCGGVTLIDFHREAASLEGAIRSAIADVNNAGYVVSHATIEAEAVTIVK